jgi:hypothetical protein
MMSTLLEVIGALAILASFSEHLSLHRKTQDRHFARLKLLLAKFRGRR